MTAPPPPVTGARPEDGQPTTQSHPPSTPAREPPTPAETSSLPTTAHLDEASDWSATSVTRGLLAGRPGVPTETKAAPASRSVGYGAARAQAEAIASASAFAEPMRPPRRGKRPATADHLTGESTRRSRAGRSTRNRRLGGSLRLAQIACWQLIAALVISAYGKSERVVFAAGVASALLLLLTAVPWHDRWLYQWLRPLIAFLIRRRAYLVDPDMPFGQTLLDAVSQGARVEALDIGDTEIGVIAHPGGMTGVFASTASESRLVASRSWQLPALAELLPHPDPDGLSVTVQLVLRCVPAITTVQNDAKPALSYHQLTRNRIPLKQSAWLAVQVQRDLGHLYGDSLRTALANVLRRVRRHLRQVAPWLEPLTPDRILPAVEAIAGPMRVPTEYVLGRSRPYTEVFHERWTTWQGMNLPHCTFQLCQHGSVDGRALISTLTSAPAEAVTLAIAARRDGQRVETELVVDIAARDSRALDMAAGTMIDGAAGLGGRLVRLDGYHRAGLANVIPLGGFLPC